MKKLSNVLLHLLLVLLAACLVQSCERFGQKENQTTPDETSAIGDCPKVDENSISHNCSGPDSNRTCVSTWTAPTGVNSFLVKAMELSATGEPLQPFLEQTVTGNSITIDSLIKGKPYRLTIETLCSGGRKSGIVIDDLIRK